MDVLCLNRLRVPDTSSLHGAHCRYRPKLGNEFDIFSKELSTRYIAFAKVQNNASVSITDKDVAFQSLSAIDPTRPELSAKGKVVAITGGGGSIGGAAALAFAKAGSTSIAIIGRRIEPLKSTKDEIEKAVRGAKVLVVPGDLSNAGSMKQALQTIANEFGKINVLVANAGYLSSFDSITQADPDEWWTGFEINTKGAFNTVRAFLPVAAPESMIIDVSTCVVHMPAMASASGYVSSKLAGTKIYETAAAENKNLSVVHVHPGVIYSELNVKSGITAADDGEYEYTGLEFD